MQKNRSKNHRNIFIINRQEIILIITGVVLITFAFFVIRPLLTNYFYWRILNPENLIAQNYDQVDRLLNAYRPIRNWSVPEPDLDLYAASAIEIRLDGSVKNLLARNADHPYIIASITKLMTAIVAIDLFELDQQVTISREASDQDGQVGILKEGDYLNVKNILYLMLMESNNGAAYALAENRGVTAFINEMNKKAILLGLDNTTFVTPSGLNGSNGMGNRSTAHELTQLIAYLWQDQDYEIIRSILATNTYPIYDETGAFYYRVINNNQLLGYYSELEGGKTGYLPAAGECLISVFKMKDIDTHLVIVVLGSKNRFEDTKKIVEWLPKAYLYSSNYYGFRN